MRNCFLSWPLPFLGESNVLYELTIKQCKQAFPGSIGGNRGEKVYAFSRLDGTSLLLGKNPSHQRCTLSSQIHHTSHLYPSRDRIRELSQVNIHWEISIVQTDGSFKAYHWMPAQRNYLTSSWCEGALNSLFLIPPTAAKVAPTLQVSSVDRWFFEAASSSCTFDFGWQLHAQSALSVVSCASRDWKSKTYRVLSWVTLLKSERQEFVSDLNLWRIAMWWDYCDHDQGRWLGGESNCRQMLLASFHCYIQG